MTTIDDVAATILRTTGALSTMKLQKLVYYSQAWHLALVDRPLFPAPFQAWANGPVAPALFDKHRRQFSVERIPSGDPDHVIESGQAVVTLVLAKYGHCSADALSRHTHSERPWLQARADLPEGAWCVETISQDSMRNFYSELGLDYLVDRTSL